MNAQTIKKAGKIEYAVIPYKEYMRMRESIEDYEDLKALRKAKREGDYLKRRPYEDAARELGLLK